MAENGFVVDVAKDGIDGKHLALHGEYDLVVLDVMLPGIDGFGVLNALRESRNTPVLMLTVRNRVEDLVKGLQDGADNYLVKPIAFSELLARLQVLGRRGVRPSADDTNVLQPGPLEFDLAKRTATRDGQRLADAASW